MSIELDSQISTHKSSSELSPGWLGYGAAQGPPPTWRHVVAHFQQEGVGRVRRVGHLQRRVEGREQGALSRAAAVVLPFLRANTLISRRGGMREGGATNVCEPNFRFPSGRGGGREGGSVGIMLAGWPSSEDDISYDTTGHYYRNLTHTVPAGLVTLSSTLFPNLHGDGIGLPPRWRVRAVDRSP